MEMLIGGCEDCPFCKLDYDDTYYCSFPKKELNNYIIDKFTPEWCPLKKEEITIKYIHYGN